MRRPISPGASRAAPGARAIRCPVRRRSAPPSPRSRRASTPPGAASGPRPSSPGRRCRRSSSAITAARATRTRSPWRRRRSSAGTGAETDAAVGEAQGRLVRAFFDVTPEGDFDHGQSVLWRPRPPAEVAAGAGVTVEELAQAIDAARPALLAARARREPPATDRKILVAWNGLMVSAFARGALVLGEPRYLAAARRAAALLVARAVARDRLRHELAEGRATGEAFLDDYAFLIAGLLDLFEVDPDPRWPRQAIALQERIDADFADAAAGGALVP